jgi:predicted CopG family antitoxin
MYTMAKTIMISNNIYNELKMRKKNRSFSELITDLLYVKKKRTGEGLKECIGLLKGDKEFAEIRKDLDKGWKKWNKKYV